MPSHATASAPASGLLHARELGLRRDGRWLLQAATLSLRPGEFTVVVGPNGAGKSTLLRCLSGEWLPDAGEVRFGQRLLADWPAAELARQRAVLAQQTPLNFPFQVEAVVALGRLPHRRFSSAQEDAAAVERALRKVELLDFRQRAYTTLSGGERQRVQLARVLAQLDAPAREADGGGRVLFLDEPINALDIRHQCRILSLAKAAAAEGMAVFAVLHDLNFALRFGDRLLLLRDGRIQYDVPPRDCTEAMLEAVFQIQLRAIDSNDGERAAFFFLETPSFVRRGLGG